MIDVYMFILIMILLGLSITGFLIVRHRYQRVLKSVVKLAMEKGMLIESIEKLELENSKEANDGFVKFLSQSRETAFKYIEDVQVAIQNYADVVETGTDDEIKIARMELFSHLPEIPEEDLTNGG